MKPYFLIDDEDKTLDQIAFGEIFGQEKHEGVRTKCQRHAGPEELDRRAEKRDVFNRSIAPMFTEDLMQVWFNLAVNSGYLPSSLNAEECLVAQTRREAINRHKRNAREADPEGIIELEEGLKEVTNENQSKYAPYRFFALFSSNEGGRCTTEEEQLQKDWRCNFLTSCTRRADD